MHAIASLLMAPAFRFVAQGNLLCDSSGVLHHARVKRKMNGLTAKVEIMRHVEWRFCVREVSKRFCQRLCVL